MEVLVGLLYAVLLLQLERLYSGFELPHAYSEGLQFANIELILFLMFFQGSQVLQFLPLMFNSADF